MGVRFLVFRESFLSLNPLDPFTIPSTILLADLQEWQSLLHSKHFLQVWVSSPKHFFDRRARPVSSLALCWSILLHGLPFIHALSYFPDPPSFSESLFFVFLIPWSPHRTVGPPAYHTYLCTGKWNSSHSFPPSLLFIKTDQDPNTSHDTWSGPQEESVTCLSFFG